MWEGRYFMTADQNITLTKAQSLRSSRSAGAFARSGSGQSKSKHEFDKLDRLERIEHWRAVFFNRTIFKNCGYLGPIRRLIKILSNARF